MLRLLSPRPARRALLLGWLTLSLPVCSPTGDPTEFSGSAASTSSGIAAGGAAGSGGSASGDGGGLSMPASGSGGATECGPRCSYDGHSVLACDGDVVQTCTGLEGCDDQRGMCADACQVAVANGHAVGCEYYATFMDTFQENACFAAFVANTWNVPAHIEVEYAGISLAVETFAYLPSGAGAALTYQPLDAAAGIPPGEVAILFLGGPHVEDPQPLTATCPFDSAVPYGAKLHDRTGIGKSFRIGSDVPVVAYQINPYGGGSAAVTAASLLLPTSVWGHNYLAVNVYEHDIDDPSLNIVAAEDGTVVTLLPVAAVEGGDGVPAGPANAPLEIVLDRGEQAQLTQAAALTGSVVHASKPVGFMAGHRCMRVPAGVTYCDHGEQMIPPVKALGSEYVGVMHRPRQGEPGFFRLIGAVDGTQLTWSKAVGGPAQLSAGQVVELVTAEPFVVKSQDDDHPFMLFSLMTSNGYMPGLDGYGDPEFVVSVPPRQYRNAYVFFADPTYPETNLVLVRMRVGGSFAPVVLDCAGEIGGWQAVGADFEWTRIDLSTGNFQGVGGCSTGRHEIHSDLPFGLWVWGWGTPETGMFGEGEIFTRDVSYGYPGGMNVQPINGVEVLPVPR